MSGALEGLELRSTAKDAKRVSAAQTRLDQAHYQLAAALFALGGVYWLTQSGARAKRAPD